MLLLKAKKFLSLTNSSNIELNKEEATTNQLGKVDFKIAGAAEGTYKIYVTWALLKLLLML